MPCRPARLPVIAVLCLFAGLTQIAAAQDRLVEAQLLPGDPARTALALTGAEPFHVAAGAAAELRTIPLPDDELVVLWEEGDEAHPVSHFAVLREGALVGRVRPAAHDLLLRHGILDPVATAPDLSGSLLGEGEGGLAVVQFHTQILESYRERLLALGASVVSYMPHQALVVRLAPALREEVRALPEVRWVGSYHPEYRLEPFLRERLLDAALTTELEPALRYRLQVSERGPGEKAIVANRLRLAGAEIDELHPQGFWFDATLTPDQLALVVTWDEVVWVDRWTPPESDMDRVRILGGADNVEAATGWNGQGVRCEVMDGSIRATHGDFPGLVLHGMISGDSDHGTKCAGIVFGTGDADALSRGMLPAAEQRYFASYREVGNRYTHTAELVSAPYNCVFQSNSWGGGRTLSYTGTSAQMDDIIFINDILICQSQSNAGDQMSRPQAWAKNIVSVGGIRHYNNVDPSDDAWAGGASIGPAADGRLKPDLSYYYDAIRCADNESDTDYTFSMGGTSAATPITAGHFGVMYQMWRNGIFGNVLAVPGGTVFENRPHASTAKAMMINSAQQYTFSGTGHDLTRVHQGFGVPNLDNLYNRRDDFAIVDETDVLTSMSSTSYEVFVTAGQPELKITLVYMDYMGTTSAMQHRINDLSLRVTSPVGTVYWGNNGLDAENYSSSGGTSNTLDTVENVYVQSPPSGVWTIDVFADEVNADTHVETMATDADYALVASPVDPLPDCSLTGPMAGPLSGDISLPIDITNGGFPGTLADIAVHWSTDGGVTTTPCTAAAGSPLANPAMSQATPGSYSFIWDSVTDSVGATMVDSVVFVVFTNEPGSPGSKSCQSSSFTVNNVPAPQCMLTTPTSPATGDILIPLSTTSVAATVDLTFQYSLDGGATWMAATAAAGSALSNPASSVTTGASSFTWDSVADGAAPTAPVAGVLFEASTGDGLSLLAGSCATAAFAVNNVPAPTCTVAVTTPSPVVGDASFSLVLSSTGAAAVDVTFDYSLDAGATWSACTAAATSSLPSPASGVAVGAAGFEWDTLADMVATTAPSTALVRLSVGDAVALGTSTCQTMSFDVNNVPAPTGTLGVSALPSGDVSLDLDSMSTGASQVDTTFEFSLDGGLTWQVCLAAGGSTISNPATAVPEGMSALLWDTIGDSVGLMAIEVGVLARVTLGDAVALGTTVATSTPFDINNVPAPTCTIAAPAAGVRDTMFLLTLAATAAANVDLTLEFSLDGGATYQLATPAPTSLLTNPATGVPVGMAEFLWDTVADSVATAAPTMGVVMRVTVTDVVAIPSGSCASAPFDIDNSGICLGLCGDCNLSGTGPDVLDSLQAATFAAGLGSPMGMQIGCCDIDADGDVDVLDSLGIAQNAVGLPVILTCP